MNENQILRDYRAHLKARLECGCLMNNTPEPCLTHGPRDAADIMLVSCIYMSEHIRHYGTSASPPQQWTLPAPPEGRQWHRTDWTQELLPDGYRPVLNGEMPQAGDEVFSDVGWWVAASLLQTVPTGPLMLHMRTRRPLPPPCPHGPSSPVPGLWDEMVKGQSAEHVVEEKPSPVTREQRMEILAPSFCGVSGHFRFQQNGNACLMCQRESRLQDEAYEKARIQFTTENAALKERVKDEAVRCGSLLEELTRLRSQFRWTPISERLPTEKDGMTPPKLEGHWVLWTNLSYGPWVGTIKNSSFNGEPATHWMCLSPLSSPPETEEQTSRKQFEAWATDCGYEDFKVTPWGAYENENTDYAWSAWNAGRQSTEGQA